MVLSLNSLLFLLIDRSQLVKLEELYDDLLDRMQECFRIGYEALIRYVHIAYYPSSNRNTGPNNCCRYPPIKRRCIDELTISESRIKYTVVCFCIWNYYH